MIENPDQYIEGFSNAGADIITVHEEACPHLHRTIQLIKSTGKKSRRIHKSAYPRLLADRYPARC